MKDLSVEQKAKRYDEALGKARQLCDYPTSKPFISDLQDLFPELKESEDERIKNEIIDYISTAEDKVLIPYESWIAWLEKQGEQKPVDKVEPKFKAGDWVVTRYGTASQVISVDEDVNGYTLDDGVYFSGTWCNSYHLWTIKDAKEGDVLAGKIDGDSYILIYKQIKDGWIETYGHYYDSVDRFCVPSQLFCRDVKGAFRPATKEQRDLLFQKIKESGYEWVADKKELIKL